MLQKEWATHRETENGKSYFGCVDIERGKWGERWIEERTINQRGFHAIRCIGIWMFNFSLKLQCFTFFRLTIWLRLIDNSSGRWLKFVSINSPAYRPEMLVSSSHARNSFLSASNPLISQYMLFFLLTNDNQIEKPISVGCSDMNPKQSALLNVITGAHSQHVPQDSLKT